MRTGNNPIIMLSACLATVSVWALSKPARAQDQPPAQPAPTSSVKGPFAPDFDPKALWDGRKMAPFKALDMPNMVLAGEADFMDPNEYVLGVIVKGQSRAYPTRFIWWHHVVNDKVTVPNAGESYFAVTYCSVCNTGLCYDLMVDGKPRRLDFFGLYNAVVALCDRDTESVFQQAGGRYLTGPLMGKELKQETILDTTWTEWQRLHPDTLVMSPDGAYSKYYRSKDRPEPRGYDRFPMPFFRMSLTKMDKRLPPFDKVLGVTIPQKDAGGKDHAPVLSRAYPMKTLQESGNVINDTLGDVPVVVFFDPGPSAANATLRKVAGRTLTFEARKAEGKPIAFYDKETGTRWSIEGKGEAGPLAGKKLDRIDNHLSQWYGWFAYNPDTTIFGRTDPPQPGDYFESVEQKPPPAEKH